MWDDLDIQQKSELMRLFIKNNIYSLDKMKEIYNDTTERQYSSGCQIQHIEPSKRGTFKAQASRMGLTVQEAASHILTNKGNYSPAMVNKANFARNFAHADGGNLFFTGGPFATDPPIQLTYTPKYQPVYSTDYSKPIVAFNPSDNTRVVQQPKITSGQYQANVRARENYRKQRANKGIKTEPIDRNIEEKISAETSSPAKYFLRNIFKNVTNSDSKGFEYNEHYLNDKQLNVLDNQVRQKMIDLGYNDDYFNNHPNDTIRFGYTGEDYYKAKGNVPYGNGSIIYKLFDPFGQIETSLGQYNVEAWRDGYRIFDTYDFNSNQGRYANQNGLIKEISKQNKFGLNLPALGHSVYISLRRAGNDIGLTDKDEDRKKDKFKIERKVNTWN